MATSLEEAGENLFTFTRLPESQWKSARTTNAIEHDEGEGDCDNDDVRVLGRGSGCVLTRSCRGARGGKGVFPNALSVPQCDPIVCG